MLEMDEKIKIYYVDVALGKAARDQDGIDEDARIAARHASMCCCALIVVFFLFLIFFFFYDLGEIRFQVRSNLLRRFNIKKYCHKYGINMRYIFRLSTLQLSDS